MNLSLVIDVRSIELFADNGLTVMTAVFYPNKPLNQIHIQSYDSVLIKKLENINLKSIWDNDECFFNHIIIGRL